MKHELDLAASVSSHEQRLCWHLWVGIFLKGELNRGGLLVQFYLGIWGLNWSLGHETSDQQVCMFPSTEKINLKTMVSLEKSLNGLAAHVPVSSPRGAVNERGVKVKLSKCLLLPPSIAWTHIFTLRSKLKETFPQVTSVSGQPEGWVSCLPPKGQLSIHIRSTQINIYGN